VRLRILAARGQVLPSPKRAEPARLLRCSSVKYAECSPSSRLAAGPAASISARSHFVHGLLVAAVLLLVSGAARPDGFALVRNARSGTATLSRAQIKEIATGKRRTWPHGPVVVLVLPRPGTPELAWFARSLVGMTEDALLARIREQVFKGEMRKPLTAATEQDVLTAVAGDPGAMGVIHEDPGRKLPEGVLPLTVK
jgi:hypothetical protein